LRSFIRLVFAANRQDHRRDRSFDTPFVITLPEVRRNLIPDDLIAYRIRQNALQTFSNFNPRFSVFKGNK
jgi:hypothetical protein